jgi:hypothetical protein
MAAQAVLAQVLVEREIRRRCLAQQQEAQMAHPAGAAAEALVLTPSTPQLAAL